MQRFVWLLLAGTALACSSASSGGAGAGGVALMSGFSPPAAPAEGTGWQFITPIITDITPGASDEYCTWTDVVAKEDTWINATKGYQSEGGHHVVFYYQSPPVAPTTRLCTNEDMAEFKFGLAPNGGTEQTILPGDLAVKIPAGAQIVINHHYLNANTKPIAQAQSALNVYFADPNKPKTQAGAIAVTNTSMTVPVGASAYDVNCTFNKAYNLFELLPHMHAWGTHVNVDHTSSSGTERIFDVDWNPDYAFDISAIAKFWDISKPYQIQAGDSVHIECDYMNTTNAALPFGNEMCVLFGMTINSDDLACDGGRWTQF